jgi:hypothetical protein
MSGVTGECLTFLLLLISFSENACARALAFTLDVISQDDAADPTPTGASFWEETAIEYGYGEAAAEFRSVPIEV